MSQKFFNEVSLAPAPAGRGWLIAPMISALAEFRPVRAVYAYMDRLRRRGLVHRRKPLGGPILWSIFQCGRQRVAWLNRSAQILPTFSTVSQGSSAEV